MSYCPTASPIRQEFLPGVSSISDGRRTSHARSPQSVSMTYSFESQIDFSSPLPLASVWGLVPSTGDSPEPRSGQTVVFWPEDHSVVACYGRNHDDSFSDAFWKFSINEKKWIKLPVDDVTPRAACGSALINNNLWFFGGITSSSFASDLHYVNLETYEVTYPVTTGDPPPPCALPLVAYYYQYLIVWSGTSGSNLSSLHILDMDEMHWKQIDTDYIGRQGAIGTVIDSTLYIFGASSPMSILALDLNEFTFQLLPTTGFEPPHGLDCLTTAAVGSTFLVFETIGLSSKTRLFVFDTERCNWTSYTVPIKNGDEQAQDYSPKIVFYLPDERKLLALCENSNSNSQPLTELNIGKSIATLNQRLDLLAMLQK